MIEDTDFIVRILDVYTDGHGVMPYAGDGAIRARYRTGYERTEPPTRNSTGRYTIDVGDIDRQDFAGHRIRVEVTSSSFLNISPNTYTGNPIATDVQARVAVQHILHDRHHASYVDLAVASDVR